VIILIKNNGNKTNREHKRHELLKANFNIYGMHCKSCKLLIENKIKELDGVSHIDVDLRNESAVIFYDSSIISKLGIKNEIELLGYSTSKFVKPKKIGFFQSIKQEGLHKAIIYGLVPHIGCIGFLIASIIGATFFVDLFKPLLMSKYFFHGLIAISFLMASISVVIYLSKNEFLNFAGIKRKWKYIGLMYGITIFVNLFLFMVIFPLTANISSSSGQIYSSDLSGNDVVNSPLNSETKSLVFNKIQLKVDIPCPGHAPLISGELKKLIGVKSVQYSFPNLFMVEYDDSIISESDILSISVFNEYPASVVLRIDEADSSVSGNNIESSSTSSCDSGSCSVSRASSGCDGSCGSPTCGGTPSKPTCGCSG
jgi:copper chaperone CopZ